ncbi:MAG: hypothetical protein LBC30_03865 [Puniceicoccales bacterium]|jgi:hypothetical protein|nr:hypothetical protein [Puniceicoccales bacterium]
MDIRAVSEQKIIDIKSAFDSMFKHEEGISRTWFNASAIASLMEPAECSALKKKCEPMNDLFSRADLAHRRVNILRGSKRTSAKAGQEYRSAKERLQRLVCVIKLLISGADMPEPAFIELIRQADNGIPSVNYDEEMARLTDRQVKDTMGNHCEAITNSSSNPEIMAIEKSMKEDFGIKVSFDNNLSLAQQTYEMCQRVKSLGHKLPDEIVLFKTPEAYCRGTTIFENDNHTKRIIIANVDPRDVSNSTDRLFVDASFKGVLLREIGHINTANPRRFSDAETCHFAQQFKAIFESTVGEIISTLPNEEVANIAKGDMDILKIIGLCNKKLTQEDINNSLNTLKWKLFTFMDDAQKCLGKRIATEVSLHAAISEYEFMAEVYCGCMLGKTYTPEIMEEYKRLKGRPFK